MAASYGPTLGDSTHPIQDITIQGIISEILGIEKHRITIIKWNSEKLLIGLTHTDGSDYNKKEYEFSTLTLHNLLCSNQVGQDYALREHIISGETGVLAKKPCIQISARNAYPVGQMLGAIEATFEHEKLNCHQRQVSAFCMFLQKAWGSQYGCIGVVPVLDTKRENYALRAHFNTPPPAERFAAALRSSNENIAGDSKSVIVGSEKIIYLLEHSLGFSKQGSKDIYNQFKVANEWRISYDAYQQTMQKAGVQAAESSEPQPPSYPPPPIPAHASVFSVASTPSLFAHPLPSASQNVPAEPAAPASAAIQEEQTPPSSSRRIGGGA